jgi:hypothetical protein
MRRVIDTEQRAVRTRPLLRQKNEKQLLETFGREPNSGRPFVKVSAALRRCLCALINSDDLW